MEEYYCQGECPKCGKEVFECDDSFLNDEQAYTEKTCPYCGTQFQECSRVVVTYDCTVLME
jgi:DNA-directed RNA polymerase subunit RPC12/RpoP